MKIEAGPRRDMEVDPQKQEWNVDENGKRTKDYQEVGREKHQRKMEACLTVFPNLEDYNRFWCMHET